MLSNIWQGKCSCSRCCTERCWLNYGFGQNLYHSQKKLWREREKYISIIGKEESAFYKFLDGICIDGRKDATLVIEHEAQTGKYYKKWAPRTHCDCLWTWCLLLYACLSMKLTYTLPSAAPDSDGGAQVWWEAPCADTESLGRVWSMKSLVFPRIINVYHYDVILWRNIC